jgi:hypothetical protein
MAEAAATVPTFKLVLVGDGGTGKVCLIGLFSAPSVVALLEAHLQIPCGGGALWDRSISNSTTDYVRQAPFDRRI